MGRGLNRPFLEIGQSGDDREALAVKPRAGQADRPEAMVRELFALLLARSLGLLALERCFVELLDSFGFAAADHSGYRS